MLPGVDRGYRSGNHEDEAHDAEEWRGGDAGDQQGKPCEEPDPGDGGPSSMDSSNASSTQRVNQLRILGCEGTFHLVEEPLLLI